MSKLLNSTRNSLLFLLVLSLTVYVGTSLKFGIPSDPGLLESDELEYYNLSADLLQGEFSGRRPFVHLLVLAVLRVVTGNNLIVMQLMITAMFSLVAPLMYVLIYQLFQNRAAAFGIGLLTALWPPFVYYGGTLYSESIVLPIFVGLLILLPKGSVFGDRSHSWLQWALSGGLLGLCILIRPMYLFFVPFAVAIVFLEERQWRVALKRSAILVASCFLLMLPWSIYLSHHVGKPTLISTTGGETLSGGLNPVLIQQGYRFYRTADGRETWDGPGKWLTISRNGYLSPKELALLPYSEQDKLLRQRTIAWVLQHPGDALYLQCSKLLYMWGFYPFWNGRLQTWFGNLPSVACVLLSILAILRFRRDWRQLSRFWLLPIFVSAVALISWGSWRFRQPGDLGILALTGLLVWAVLLKPKQLFAPSGSTSLSSV